MNEVENYHWTQQYNLTGVIQGFTNQTYDELGIHYIGYIHLIVFKSEYLGEIEHMFEKDNHQGRYLAGWLPTNDNDKSGNDFILIPEALMEQDEVITKIPCFKDYIYLKLGIFRNPFDGMMVVTLEEEINEG
jgi:hypothetical protein